MIPDTIFPSLIQRFEEPDILVTRVTTEGDMDRESIVGATTQAMEIFEKRSDIYWLNFYGKSTGLTVEARRSLKRIPVLHPYAYVGVGGTLTMRALASLFLRGLSVVGRLKGKIILFENEEDARKWIAEDRARRTTAQK